MAVLSKFFQMFIVLGMYDFSLDVVIDFCRQWRSEKP